MTLPKVEYLDQTGVRAYLKVRCAHVFTRFPNSPRPLAQPCKHNACWIVDGMKLCAIHAGRKVLPVLAGMSPGLLPTPAGQAEESLGWASFDY